MSNTTLQNKSIRGLRVRATETTGYHVDEPADVYDGYRSVSIPKGAMGTCTGTILVFTEGVNEEACTKFAKSAKRIKTILGNPQLFTDLHEPPLNYWESTKSLAGEALLASRVALVVYWDDITDKEPGTLNCASYIPWLELE